MQMKWISIFMMVLLGAGFFTKAFSQCASVDFTVPPNACLNQNLFPSTPISPGNYLWDFCSGDLNNSPSVQTAFKLTGTIGYPGMEFAKDGNVWYGFVTGNFGSILYRITFANGTNNPPTFTENLGNLSGALNSPGQIRIINEGGMWFGLLHNTGNGEVLKLSFGTHLSNTITTTSLITGIGGSHSGLAIAKDNALGWVCIISAAGPSASQFMILQLGNALSSPPPTDQLLTSSVPDPNSLGDVDIINVCGEWYGFAVDYGNANVYRLKFGSSIYSNPVIDLLTTLPASNPGRLRVVQEGEEYFLFTVLLDGTITKLLFGNDITQNPTVKVDGTVADNLYGLAVAKENSVWTLLSLSDQTGQTYWINYPNNCSSSLTTSSLQNPLVSYSQAGNYQISLEYTGSSGSGMKTQPVTVSSSAAPDITFTSLNSCAQNNVYFTPANSSGNINSYAWDFGDAGTSTAANPAHIYSTPGNYSATLTVSATNACQNTVTKTNPIFNAPVASFSLPSASTICTNQNYLFPNTSSYDTASHPSWQWSVNSTPVSTNQNLNYTMVSASAQQVSLTASIPGCSSLATQTITTVLSGPAVDFNASSGCQLSPLVFTNATPGGGLTFSWDFGDGNGSTQINTSNTYSSFGIFSASLIASAPNGCENSTTKSITIYSKPAPDFTLALPPFSCTGSPSQFSDATPNLTDSNISTWTWNFGDAVGGTSNQQNPQYVYATAGNFSVALTVTTNFNCTGSVQKMVTIAPTPVASFLVGPACLAQNTQFTDLSGPTIKSRVWKIFNSSTTLQASTLPDPVYVLTTATAYTAQLTVTDNNSCVAQVSKTIVVPSPLVPDFSTQSTCAGKQAVFTDTTPAGSDPPISWTWNFNNTGMATGSPAVYTFPATGNVPVGMTITAQSGCIYSVTKTISIVTPPVAGFTTPLDAGAPPFELQFTNTSTNASSYLWKFNDAASTTSILTSPVFTYTALGNYTVELTAYGAQSCSDVFSKLIQVVQPVADLALDKLELVPMNGRYQIVVAIENKGNFPVGNPSVLLDVSGNASVEETLTLVIQPGQVSYQTLNYSFQPVAATYVCASVIETDDANPDNNKLCTTLEDQDVILGPYPNPSVGTVHLDWIAPETAVAQVMVLSSLGQVFTDLEVNGVPGLNRIGLDVSSLHSGIYLIIFKYNGHQRSFRFLVN
jgi:PKD repeat protein